METVKRLATTVSTSSTNHENKPARVRKGSLTVEISAEVKSKRPTAEMLPNSKVLFQVLGIFILLIGGEAESVEAVLEDFRAAAPERENWANRFGCGVPNNVWQPLKINQSDGWRQ